MAQDPQELLAEQWFDQKTALMEAVLGQEHDMVMHAIISYAVGGPLDLHYFPSGIRGTGIATKELSELPGQGSTNAVFHSYELVMFTRHALALDEANDRTTPFGRAHLNIGAILNSVAPYSEDAELNPYDTCEFPDDWEDVGGKCLIFDDYTGRQQRDKRAPRPGRVRPKEFGVLAVIEVFRSELDFARKRGGAKLITKLKAAGHYPYSDLDREPVV